MDKQLLILDLDETLVYGAETPLERGPDFTVGPYSVYRRPSLEAFLAQAFEWFEVAVWSSASKTYVHGVVDRLFADPSTLRFVWSRERCTQCFDAESLSYYWVKNLKKVRRLGYPLERVLMIDDTVKKLERQYGNYLRLRPYEGEADDRDLEDVLPYLDRMRSIENIRKVEKRYWRDSMRQIQPPSDREE